MYQVDDILSLTKDALFGLSDVKKGAMFRVTHFTPEEMVIECECPDMTLTFAPAERAMEYFSKLAFSIGHAKSLHASRVEQGLQTEVAV